MVGYVKRINDATLRVPIGGIRIGSARYSRLAQINLQTRIITFSRYAIENVPERGRRYLVIHELAHVKEASHNKRFWQLVADHEPKYKEIGKELERAFHQNVRSQQRLQNANGIYQARLFPATRTDDWDNFRDSLSLFPEEIEDQEKESSKASEPGDPGMHYPLDSGRIVRPNELFNCDDSEFGSWAELEEGIVYGGSQPYDELDDAYLDHI